MTILPNIYLPLNLNTSTILLSWNFNHTFYGVARNQTAFRYSDQNIKIFIFGNNFAAVQALFAKPLNDAESVLYICAEFQGYQGIEDVKSDYKIIRYSGGIGYAACI